MMYETVWLVYGLACVIALACLFWLSAKIPYAFLRWLLRLICVALCFTPVQASSSGLWFAPAIAALALDILSRDTAGAIMHGGVLLGSLLISALFAALLAFLLQKKS